MVCRRPKLFNGESKPAGAENVKKPPAQVTFALGNVALFFERARSFLFTYAEKISFETHDSASPIVFMQISREKFHQVFER